MNATKEEKREYVETVNYLTKEAIKFLAVKNGVSEKHIAIELASLNDNLIKQIQTLVQAALSEMWETFNK